jgi:phosphoribosylglycinamide formyltransferase
MKPSIVVLISGNGSNLQAIIDATENGMLNATISLVISNRKAAFGLERATKHGIPTLLHQLKPYTSNGKSRIDYDIDLAQKILDNVKDVKLIVLAGFMHILSKEFLDTLNGIDVINLHPALPGEFDGAHAIERAYDAFKEGKISRTGIMVHKVIPEVDRGEVILQREVPIDVNDSLQDLEDKIHKTEHVLIVEGCRKVLELQSSQA